MAADLVIVGADLGAGERAQLRLAAGRSGAVIAAIGERVEHGGATVLDVDGAAVLPGFVDHHLHLHAMAVAQHSVRCGPPAVATADQLRDALRAHPADPHGWVRGIGYIETVAGDLDRHALDALDDRRPIRIQHRSGALWILNSVALQRIGADAGEHPGIERTPSGEPTGLLWRADDWLRARLPQTGPPALDDVGERLRRLGVVEVTDATPDLDTAAIDHLVGAIDDGTLSGRLNLLGVPLGQHLDHPRVRVGPYKIVIADSSLPGVDDLAEQIDAAHRAGRAVAVHCVSGVAFALLLAAWEMVGVRPGDRIEHAALVPEASAADLAARGVSVVTQPGFLSDRGDDFLAGTDPGEHDDLYRCGSLIRAGVPVVLSSDAPYGPLDPWQIVAAAVARRTASGCRVGEAVEVLSPEQALVRIGVRGTDPAGRPARIAVGEPADLVIADRPLPDILAAPGSVRLRHTIIDGGIV